MIKNSFDNTIDPIKPVPTQDFSYTGHKTNYHESKETIHWNFLLCQENNYMNKFNL